MGVISILKIIFLVIDSIFLLGIGFVIYKGYSIRPDISPRRKPSRRTFTLRDEVFQERWNSIRRKVETGTIESVKMAIIEADKLADEALKLAGFEGEHMADRLAQINEEELPSMKALWRAHRLRNDLVHTPGYQITIDKAKSTLEDYEKFLTEFGILASNGNDK